MLSTAKAKLFLVNIIKSLKTTIQYVSYNDFKIDDKKKLLQKFSLFFKKEIRFCLLHFKVKAIDLNISSFDDKITENLLSSWCYILR